MSAFEAPASVGAGDGLQDPRAARGLRRRAIPPTRWRETASPPGDSDLARERGRLVGAIAGASASRRAEKALHVYVSAVGEFSALPFDQEWLLATSLLAETSTLVGDTDSAIVLRASDCLGIVGDVQRRPRKEQAVAVYRELGMDAYAAGASPVPAR